MKDRHEYEFKSMAEELPDLVKVDDFTQLLTHWALEQGKRAFRQKPQRVWLSDEPLITDAERPAGGTVRLATEWPRLSAMPYALIISVLSVGLLFLIRMFAAGGLSLPVFLLGSIGFVATGLMGCVVIAVKSWRAAVGLRQWQRELEVKPREWVWE
jgi:hypothetical protein